MLAPDARAVLLDQLRPPAGFSLDAAVATTFTLDLTAALVPPLAFASFELRGTPDPVAALEAVRSCADRVDVFCQAGAISIPSHASDLVAFLEPMVHEVRRPRPWHLFHPKIWFLRYAAAGEEPTFRLLTMSRNLTRDHSWDVMLRLDGRRKGGPKTANRPMGELIRALPRLATKPLAENRIARIEALAEDIRRVEWDLPEDVWELAFHVYGLRGVTPAATFDGYRHLVIAPFVNDAGLEHVAPSSSNVTIVSRVEDLDRLNPATAARLTAYVVSSIAGLDEGSPTASELDDHQVLSGLHAKLYVAERNRRAHVFIGSANATDAAFGGNVELLVELVGGATKLGVDSFLADDSPFRTMLESYSAAGGGEPDPLDAARRALDDLLRDLADNVYGIDVSASVDAGFTVTISSQRPLPAMDHYRVTMELLTRPGEARELVGRQTLVTTISAVPLADVTPFLVARATSEEGLDGGTVIRGVLANDPSGRLDEVLARQVDTPEKFLRFLALLLGLGNADLMALLASGQGDNSTNGYVSIGPFPGIFELTVRALAERPEALADLDQLVSRLSRTESGKKVLPMGFEELWGVVTAARRQLHEHHVP